MPPESIFLSIGCGPALIENKIQKLRDDITIITLDLNPEMIMVVPSILHPILADAKALPFSAEIFDVIVCITSLEFMKQPKITLQEIRRVLKPKGLFLALLLNPDSPYIQSKRYQPDSYIGHHLNSQSYDQIFNTVQQLFKNRTITTALQEPIEKNRKETTSNSNRLIVMKAIK